MSSAAVTLTLARLPVEEGTKPFAYNDATGARVTCRPSGNLSIGIGINLETGLDNEEMAWLTAHRLGKLEAQLLPLPWYAGLDPARQSVVLDIGFNEGMHGLLGYPHMIAALALKNWEQAAQECSVANTDPKLDASRYAPLRAILRTGAT